MLPPYPSAPVGPPAAPATRELVPGRAIEHLHAEPEEHGESTNVRYAARFW